MRYYPEHIKKFPRLLLSSNKIVTEMQHERVSH